MDISAEYTAPKVPEGTITLTMPVSVAAWMEELIGNVLETPCNVPSHNKWRQCRSELNKVRGAIANARAGLGRGY